jgi:hypothetical protein
MRLGNGITVKTGVFAEGKSKDYVVSFEGKLKMEKTDKDLKKRK